MDSLNALILIQKEHPELLLDRQIHIHMLDLHHEAPGFGPSPRSRRNPPPSMGWRSPSSITSTTGVI